MYERNDVILILSVMFILLSCQIFFVSEDGILVYDS